MTRWLLAVFASVLTIAHTASGECAQAPDSVVLEYAARSFKLAGFRDIVFLGDHGGYQRGERAVADRLDREWAAASVRVHAIEEYYRAGQAEFARLLKGKGFHDEEVGTHAGLA